MSATATAGVLDTPLRTASGQHVTLRDAMQGEGVLFAFVRSLADAAREPHVHQLLVERHRLDALGVRVVLIGAGEPPDAAALRDGLICSFPVLADVGGAVHAALGLPVGSGAVLAIDRSGREVLRRPGPARIEARDLRHVLQAVCRYC